MSSEKRDTYGKFLASYLKELVDTPDAEILASERASAAPDFGAKLLGRAKAEAGRRRLHRAKAAVAAKGQMSAAVKPTLTPAAARALLKEYATDSRLTLAARNLDELSDDDVVRLGEQLQQLEEIDHDPGKEGV